MDPKTAILIGAPFAVGLASLGPAIGIGYLTGQFFNSSARQPDIQASLNTNFFIAAGMIELLGLLGFVSLVLIMAQAFNFVGLGSLFPAA